MTEYIIEIKKIIWYNKYMTKINNEQILEIVSLRKKGIALQTLADKYGLTRQALSLRLIKELKSVTYKRKCIFCKKPFISPRSNRVSCSTECSIKSSRKKYYKSYPHITLKKR